MNKQFISNVNNRMRNIKAQKKHQVARKLFVQFYIVGKKMKFKNFISFILDNQVNWNLKIVKAKSWE